MHPPYFFGGESVIVVKKQTLVLIAALVWTAAGANILRIGIAAALSVRWEWWMILSAIAVFGLFLAMFLRIVGKHLKRIYGYAERKHCFLKFFDVKAYILMGVMMTGGILLRTLGVIPDMCTAMFYTGLGGALTAAGLTFGAEYCKKLFLRKKTEGEKKLDKKLYENYVKILKEELLPAMGCTEPIAVAYAAACARELLGATPHKVTVEASGNIVKNVKSVVVPHTGGLRGIEAAAAAGVVAGDASKELEVLSAVSEEECAAIGKFLQETEVSAVLMDTPRVFDLRVTAEGGGHTASARIVDFHTNLAEKTLDGETVFQKPFDPEWKEELTDRSCLSVENIFRFAEQVNIEDVREVLSRQIEYNMAIAEEGLKNPYGANIGKVLLKNAGEDVRIRARAYAAAASDARMNGCEMPVVIVSGSGNQGITASVPVAVYARETGADEEKLFRALALSDLITIHLKTGIGRLSAYCGAVSAGVGAGAGIEYLRGGGADEIAHTVVNAVAIASGIICDGAKASCAAKISQSVEAGILGYEMYEEGNEFYGGDGIVTKGVENTIKNVGRLARGGMAQTDKEILDIMLGCKNC